VKRSADRAPDDGRQRIDKWLWHARIARTRSAAQAIAVSGKLRINKIKNDSAAHPVRPGDVLTISGNGRVRVLRVRAMADRRASPGKAVALYDDLTADADGAPSAG
jgi:ribosome-associated heat shock protein Hsp15